jgi:hypothetical protein
MKLCICLCLLAISESVLAQNQDSLFLFPLPTATIRADAKGDIFFKRIEGKMNHHYYVFEYPTIYNYDSLLKSLGERKLIFKNSTEDLYAENSKEDFYGVFPYGNKLFMITSGIIKKSKIQKEKQLRLQYLDPNDLKSIGDPRVIENIEYNKKDNPPYYLFATSPDSTLYAIIALTRRKASSEIEVSIKVIDRNLSVVWKNKRVLKSNENKYTSIRPLLKFENNGDLFFLLQANKSDQKNAYFSYGFSNNGMKDWTSSIPKLKNKLLDILYFYKGENNQLNFIGEYSNKDTLGICYIRLDLDRDEIAEVKLKPINEAISRHNTNKKNPVLNFNINGIIETHNSNRIILFEYKKKIQTKYHTYYINGDVLAVNIDQRGEVVWEKYIKKFQFESNWSIKSSYQCIYLPNDSALYLVFNQKKTGNNGYFNCIARVPETGPVQQRSLFDSSYYSLQPFNSAILDNKILFYATKKLNGDENCLIELDFNRLENPEKIYSYDFKKTIYKNDSLITKSIEFPKTEKYKNHYVGFSFSTNANYFHANNGLASVNFSYIQIEPTTSVKSNHNAFFNKKFHSNLLPTVGFGIENLNKYFYVEGGGCIATSKKSLATNTIDYTNLYIGSGYNRMMYNDRIGIRVGARLNNYIIHSELGRINNQNDILKIDHNLFMPSYKNDDESYTYIHYTQVSLLQKKVGISPMLGIEYWSKKGLLNFRFNVAYNLALSIRDSIQLQQVDKNGTERFPVNYGLQNSFVNYKYNDSKSSHGPYSNNNLVFSFQVIFKMDYKRLRNMRRKRI